MIADDLGAGGSNEEEMKKCLKENMRFVQTASARLMEIFGPKFRKSPARTKMTRLVAAALKHGRISRIVVLPNGEIVLDSAKPGGKFG